MIGTPGDDVAAMQADFIEGKMPYDETISYVRFCEYMIFYANCRQGEPAELLQGSECPAVDAKIPDPPA